MSEIELRNCPFCGCNDVKVQDAGYNHVAIRCQNPICKAQGLRSYHTVEAIEAWNTRVIEEELVEALKEIGHVLINRGIKSSSDKKIRTIINNAIRKVRE